MNQQRIIHHIKKYIATGTIDDALIEFFDQHGKWCGDTIRWEQETPHALLERMSKSYLPWTRRTFRNRIGIVLRTSFIWGGNDAVIMSYCEILGSMIITANTPIHAPSLRVVGGNLISYTTKKVDLPWLSTVGGNLELLQTFLLNAPRLRHVGRDMLIVGASPPLIETVGGRLGVYWSFSFEAPRLKRVGACLVLSKADDIHVPVLNSVGGGILLTHLAKRIIAPKLHSVGGDFLAGSVDTLYVPLLRFVGGDMDTSKAQGFYHPRIHVEGEWTVFPNAIREWELRDAARNAIRGDPFYL